MSVTAYSYIWFSSPPQMKGDSINRQTHGTEELCCRQGWKLDQTLNMRDCGISAFHGKNSQTGALSVFLKGIQAGTIKR